MTRIALPLIVPAIAALAIVACSSLPDAGGGIVSLQLFQPSSLSIPVDSAVTLRARALDSNGDSVAAQIVWRTPDTAVVTLDSVSGVLVGKSLGSARVQASVVTLSSGILVFTIRAPYTGILLLAVSGLPTTGDYGQCSVSGPAGLLGGGQVFTATMGGPLVALNKLAPGQYIVTWVDRTINGTIYRAAPVQVQVSDSTAPATATGAYH
jgi:hypothetical protein